MTWSKCRPFWILWFPPPLSYRPALTPSVLFFPVPILPCFLPLLPYSLLLSYSTLPPFPCYLVPLLLPTAHSLWPSSCTSRTSLCNGKSTHSALTLIVSVRVTHITLTLFVRLRVLTCSTLTSLDIFLPNIHLTIVSQLLVAITPYHHSVYLFRPFSYPETSTLTSLDIPLTNIHILGTLQYIYSVTTRYDPPYHHSVYLLRPFSYPWDRQEAGLEWPDTRGIFWR